MHNQDCPACGSNQWKSAQLVHKEGLSHVNTTTNNLGIGIGGSHIGVGASRGKTKGIIQSEISKGAAPPEDNSWFTACIGGLIVTLVLGLFAHFWWFFSFIFLLGIILSSKSHSQERTNALKEYESKRICQRCGNTWIAPST